MKTVSYGVGRRIINPTLPVSLAGYFNVRRLTEVFDDIEVRAIVFREDGKQFLLVQFDLITVTEIMYRKVMEAIADLPQFNEENVLMTAIHTHTAQDYRPSCPIYDPAVLEEIIPHAKAAIHDAVADQRSGTAWCGMTFDDRFIFNRRYWMKNGKVVTNPGKLNPEIDRPEGLTDAEIPLFAVKNDKGEIDLLLAGIVNHTDTISGTELSADWVGFLHRSLEEHELAPGGMMCPLIGASGNINHFDVSTDMNQAQYAEARRLGLGYAETIRAALKDLRPVEGETFRIMSAVVEAGPAEVKQEEIDAAQATVEKYKDVPSPAEAGITLTSEHLANGEPIALKYFAQSVLDTVAANHQYRFRLSGLQIGNVVFASLPGEPFVEIGLEVRKQVFGDKCCFVVSHGNGTGNLQVGGGYIPNIWNYDRGGYETEIHSNPFERATAAKLADGWRKAAGK